MRAIKFITADIVHILNTQKIMLTIELVITYVFFLLPLAIELRELSPEIARGVLNATLPMMAPFLSLYLALISTSIIEEEKNDKVLEYLLVAPLSPLKFLGYRFLSLAFIVILLILAILVLQFIGLSFFGLADAFEPLSFGSILIISAVPATYLLLLFTLITPRKYTEMVRSISLISVFVLAPQLAGGGMEGLNLQYVVPIIMLILALIAAGICIVLKRKLIEWIMLST